MNRFLALLIALLLMVSTGCTLDENSDRTVNDKIVVKNAKDIDSALEHMTLEEKAGQMIQAERGGITLPEIAKYNIGSILSGGGSTPAENTVAGWTEMVGEMQKASRESTSGIPIIYGIDAVHGHNNAANAVIYPHNIGLGAASDAKLMKQIGKAVAIDIEKTGINWNFAPAVSIVQDIRWGRSYESFGEDAERVSPLASSYLEGLQAEGVAATAKHFIGDGFTTYGTGEGENLIDRGDVTVDLQILLDKNIPAYEAAIKSGVKTIMASFNSVSGVKMHEHKVLLTDVLRGQLGFKGVVVSDWEAISALEGTLENQVASCINAGVDMLMQPYNWREVHAAIVKGVEEDAISMARIDEAVKRILTLKLEMGLFSPYKPLEVVDLGGEEAVALAREAVSKSLVLLKNEGVLPLNRDLKYYITGPASDNVGIQCGGWTKSWQGELTGDLYGGTSIKGAFEKELAAGSGTIVTTAEEADVVILAIGEKPYAEMKGDSSDLSLNGPLSLEGNLEAVQEAKAWGKPVVTIMIAGRPLLISEQLKTWDAFVMAWLPGTQAEGIADVLFGKTNFSGTLPVTWPMTNDQASDTKNMVDYNSVVHQFKYGEGMKY